MNRTERLNAVLQEAVNLNSGPDFIWSDGIQENAPLWGFDAISVQFPSRTEVVPDDNNGANLQRVADPTGGPGFCLRQYIDLSKPGDSGRSQCSVYGFAHPEINAAADEGCYFEQEYYIPQVLSAGGNLYSWLSMFFDIHVMDKGGANRSYLSLQLLQDGSMRTSLAWGGMLYVINRDFGTPPPTSNIPVPVGRKFVIKTWFKRSVEPTTIKVWFDDELAMEWVGAINSLPSNTITEFYLAKLYGGVQIPPVGPASPWGKIERFLMRARIFKQ